MKVAILAGGFGTRLSEETENKPKPLVEVGGYPLLWHIMKHYGHYGFNDIYLALGYKGEMVKKFFVEYLNHRCDMVIDFESGQIGTREKIPENWKVNLIDTGLNTMTGGRLKRMASFLCEDTFMVTYGDGISNIDLSKLLEHHRSQGRIGTVTAVRPPARFGGLLLDKERVTEFTEKPRIGEGWINGGFMVFEPAVLSYFKDDDAVLEIDCLEKLAKEEQLTAYRHDGFWQCVDTLRDLRLLNMMWEDEGPPWKVWE